MPEKVVTEELKVFLKEINLQIRSLDLEVRKGFDEDSGLACYVFVNTVDDIFLQGSGKYNLRQMDYFKLVVSILFCHSPHSRFSCHIAKQNFVRNNFQTSNLFLVI